MGLLSRLRTGDGRGDRPADAVSRSSAPPRPAPRPSPPITADDLAELATPGWARLPPPPPLLDPMPLVVATDFERSLQSRRRPDPVLVQRLGHLILPDGPAGSVEGLAVAHRVELPAAVPAAPAPPPDLVLPVSAPASEPDGAASPSAPARVRPTLTSTSAGQASVATPAAAPGRSQAVEAPRPATPAATTNAAAVSDPAHATPDRAVAAPHPASAAPDLALARPGPAVAPDLSLSKAPRSEALANPSRDVVAPDPRVAAPLEPVVARRHLVIATPPTGLPVAVLPVAPGPLSATGAGTSEPPSARERSVAVPPPPRADEAPDSLRAREGPAPLDLALPPPGGGAEPGGSGAPSGSGAPRGPTAPLVGDTSIAPAPAAPLAPPAGNGARPSRDGAEPGPVDLALPGRAGRDRPVLPSQQPDRAVRGPEGPDAPRPADRPVNGVHAPSGLGRPMTGLPPTAVPMDKLRLAEASGRRVRVVGSGPGPDERGRPLPVAGANGSAAAPLPSAPEAPPAPVAAPSPAVTETRPTGSWPAVRPEPPAVQRAAPAPVAPLVAARRLTPRLREGQTVKDAVGRQFGVDLSAVPVDRSPAAAAESAELRATAFTDGRGVHIPAGIGPLDSPRGRAVLAHELTHVAQRLSHPGPVPAESSPLGRRMEREAQRVQQAVAAAPTAGLSSAVAGVVEAPARLPARPPWGAPAAPSGGRAANGREAPGLHRTHDGTPSVRPAPGAPVPSRPVDAPVAGPAPTGPAVPLLLTAPPRPPVPASDPLAAPKPASVVVAPTPAPRAASLSLPAPAPAPADAPPVARPTPSVDPAVMDAVMSRLGQVEALADQLLARQSTPIVAHAPRASAIAAPAPTAVPAGPVQRICEPGSTSDTHSHIVPPSPKELEKLARLLFPVLRHELRAGLREERDRSGLLTDMYGTW